MAGTATGTDFEFESTANVIPNSDALENNHISNNNREDYSIDEGNNINNNNNNLLNENDGNSTKKFQGLHGGLHAFETIDLRNETDEENESFHNAAHEMFLRIKNRNSKRRKIKSVPDPSELDGEAGVSNGGTILLKAWLGLLQIVLDWVIDIVIAAFHFSQGRYYVGALTLVFVFVGGAFVNFSLNVLMVRKGDKKFKEELRRCNPIFPYIMHIPSILPFFSCGLSVHTARKLRREKDPEEIKKLQRMMKICEEHTVTDLLYESSFEAFPQAILQAVQLLEKPTYSSISDFIPILAVLSAWYGISMAPINLAKSLNNLKVTIPEVLAGLANKGVTLLSFSIFITSSRQYFADPFVINWDLIVATGLAVLALILVADIPGIISFEIEMKLKKKRTKTKTEKEMAKKKSEDREDGARIRRLKSDWRYLVNLISLLIPLTAISFWTVTLSEKDELKSVRYISFASLFAFGFSLANIGYCCNRNLPWLGQFSTDILVLLFIGFQSRLRRMAFRDIDFQYDTQIDRTSREVMDKSNNTSLSALA